MCPRSQHKDAIGILFSKNQPAIRQHNHTLWSRQPTQQHRHLPVQRNTANCAIDGITKQQPIPRLIESQIIRTPFSLQNHARSKMLWRNIQCGHCWRNSSFSRGHLGSGCNDTR